MADKSKAKKPVKPRPFYCEKGNWLQKVSVIRRLVAYLRAFPIDRYCKIVVMEGKEKRSEEQNALWWVWNHVLIREHDNSHDADWYHAYNKLYVLLPLMLHTFERWKDEAEWLDRAIESQPTEGLRMMCSYRMIESKTLHVDEGQIYTEALQKHWNERGITLEILEPDARYTHYSQFRIG